MVATVALLIEAVVGLGGGLGGAGGKTLTPITPDVEEGGIGLTLVGAGAMGRGATSTFVAH